MAKPVVLSFIGDDRSLDAAFKRVQANAAKTGGALNAMSKFSKGMVTVGRNLTQYVTLPLGIAAYASIKAATDFQTSMTHIESLVGKSRAQVTAWSTDILKMAPALGKSPKELADALYFITSSGIKASRAMATLRISAKASAAGLGATQTVADAVTSTMNAYGQQTMSAAHATDVLLATVKYGKAEPEDLAKSIGRVISPAAVLGVKFNEVGAAIASMTDAGLDAFTATTSLRQIFVALLKPSTQINNELDKLHLSAAGLRDELQSKGLLATLETMKNAAHGNTAAFAQFFPNVRALNGFLAMLGKNSKQTNKVFGEMANVTGQTNRAFDIASQTAGFKFHQALASLTVVGIDLGNILLPFVTKAATAFAGLTTKFTTLSPATQKLIVQIAGVAAAFGPLIWVVGEFGKGIKYVGENLKLSAYVALAELLALLYIRSATFRDIVGSLGHVLGALAGFLDHNKAVVVGLAGAYTAYLIPAMVRAGIAGAAAVWEQLAKMISLAANAVLTFVTRVMEVGAAEAFAEALNPVLLGLLAIGAVAGVMWERDRKATQAATQSANDYVTSLGVIPGRLASVTSALTQAKAGFQSEVVAAIKAHGVWAAMNGAVPVLTNNLKSLSAQAQTMSRNESTLATRLHISRSAVEGLANAAGLKGTESLKTYAGAIVKSYRAAQASRNPSKVAAAGFKAVGNKATDAATAISALSQAMAAVIGNFLDAKQAQLDYKNDLVGLSKALKKSSDNMGLHNAKARESRGDFLTTAGALSTYVQKVYTQTGSQAKATAAMSKGIAQLQKIAPNTHLAATAISKLTKGFKQWTSQSFNSGKQIGTGLAHGVTAGLGQAGPAAIAAARDFGKAAAAAAKAGAGVHSPSTITFYAGQMIAEGFKSGFADRAATVTNWLSTYMRGLITPAITGLAQTYEHDLKQLAYAERQFKNTKAGHYTGKGKTRKFVPPTKASLMSGKHTVADAKNTARKAAKAWYDAVHEVVKVQNARQAGKPLLDFANLVSKGLNGALGYGKGPIETVADNLANLIKRQFQDSSGKVPQAVKQAMAGLHSLASKAASFHSGFMDSLSGSNDLTQTLGGNGNVGSADVKAFLTNQLAKVRKFAADIKILSRKHMPPDFLRQVLSGGLDNGFPIAEALVNASGSDFSQILKLQKQLASVSRATGRSAERDIFGGGLKTSTKIIENHEKHLHLKVQVDGSNKSARKQARRIAREIVKEIKIGSW